MGRIIKIGEGPNPVGPWTYYFLGKRGFKSEEARQRHEKYCKWFEAGLCRIYENKEGVPPFYWRNLNELIQQTEKHYGKGKYTLNIRGPGKGNWKKVIFEV